MESTADLPLRLPPFQRTSETSREAALALYEHTPTLQRAVWEFIHGRGARGATNEEIGDALRLGSGTVCPRVVELRNAGRIEAAGTRRTRSGRRAAVHVAVERGDE